jgi:hypothetical protein
MTSSATIKNIDTTQVATGSAVVSLIVAEATRREGLAGGLRSVQWDREWGVAILVDDAGHRQHLANVFGFDKAIKRVALASPASVGRARTGMMFDIPVTIWNLEV